MFKDVVKQFSSRHIFHYHKYIRWSTDNLISREKNYIVKLQKTLSGYVIYKTLQTIFWFWFWKLVTARFFLLFLEIIIIISRNQTSLKIFKQEWTLQPWVLIQRPTINRDKMNIRKLENGMHGEKLETYCWKTSQTAGKSAIN